jgi:nucleotide-binding universal stress UspA family protein
MTRTPSEPQANASPRHRAESSVVVGVDGSPGSSEALHWAITEARFRNVPLRAVHAWTYAGPLIPSLVGYPYSAESFDSTVDDRRQAAEEMLGRATSELAETRGIEIERVIAEGSAARVLIEAVEANDLLVVGSRGHGGFTSLLLGSVSQQCAQHAPCPVVIVRGTKTPNAREEGPK